MNVTIVGREEVGDGLVSVTPADVRRAQCEITEVLSAVAGRDHVTGREP